MLNQSLLVLAAAETAGLNYLQPEALNSDRHRIIHNLGIGIGIDKPSLRNSLSDNAR